MQSKRTVNLLTFSFPIAVPVYWITGLDFISPIIVAVAVMFHGIGAREKFSLFEISGCLLVFMQITSVAIAASSGIPIGRLLSSIYSILLMASLLSIFFFVRIVAHTSLYSTQHIIFMRGSRLLFIYCIVFVSFSALLALYLGSYRLSLPTLLGSILPIELPGIANLSMTAVFTSPDWGFGSFALPRPLIFAPWYTAGALTLFLAGMFAMLYKVVGKCGIREELLIDALLFFFVVATLTRSVIVLYALGFMLSSFLFLDRARMAISLTAIFVAIILMPWVEIGEIIGNFRNYSTESRLDSYFMGFHLTADHNFLFGLGYKPLIESVNIPVGSHSSIVSFFVRGGLFGVVLFVLMFYISPLMTWIKALRMGLPFDPINRRGLAILFRIQVMAWAWALVQEIDTAAVASTLLFISLAIVTRCLNVIAARRTLGSQSFARARPAHQARRMSPAQD